MLVDYDDDDGNFDDDDVDNENEQNTLNYFDFLVKTFLKGPW